MTTNNTFFRQALSLVFLVFLGFQSTAQENIPPTSLASPYHSVWLHTHYLQADSYEPSKAALPIHGVADKEKAKKLAIQIKQVLDGKRLHISLSKLPDQENYIDSLTKRSIYVLFPKELPEVYLEKLDGKWYYSKETIAKIAKIHKSVYPWGSDVLLSIMPAMGQQEVLGIALWQYLGLLFLLIFALVIYLLFTRLLKPFLSRFTNSRLGKNHLQGADTHLLHNIARGASLVFTTWLVIRLLPILLLPIGFATTLHTGLNIAFVIFAAYLLLRIIDLLMVFLRKVVFATRNKMDDQILPIIYRFLQIVVVFTAIIRVLGLLEVNVTALIAGISIGGLAMALAAQDTVKNLIGSVMIFIDQPFKIGDFIIAGDLQGTVEEVGFRSTRVRAVDTSMYSIPNGELANLVINNVGERTARRYNLELGVTYDTPPDLIDAFSDALKELIKAHPETINDRSVVHLNSLGASSINILIVTYFKVDSWGRQLTSTEDLLRGVLRLAEGMGVRFAFPSQALYIEDFPEKKTLVPDYTMRQEELEKVRKKVLEEFNASVKARRLQSRGF